MGWEMRAMWEAGGSFFLGYPPSLGQVLFQESARMHVGRGGLRCIEIA